MRVCFDGFMSECFRICRQVLISALQLLGILSVLHGQALFPCQATFLGSDPCPGPDLYKFHQHQTALAAKATRLNINSLVTQQVSPGSLSCCWETICTRGCVAKWLHRWRSIQPSLFIGPAWGP